jgi:hypothetical protein
MWYSQRRKMSRESKVNIRISNFVNLLSHLESVLKQINKKLHETDSENQFLSYQRDI